MKLPRAGNPNNLSKSNLVTGCLHPKRGQNSEVFQKFSRRFCSNSEAIKVIFQKFFRSFYQISGVFQKLSYVVGTSQIIPFFTKLIKNYKKICMILVFSWTNQEEWRIRVIFWFYFQKIRDIDTFWQHFPPKKLKFRSFSGDMHKFQKFSGELAKIQKNSGDLAKIQIFQKL